MKIKRLISFLFTIALLFNLCPQVAFADESYEKCIIPIISDKSEELTWDGLKKDGTLYVTLEDACILTGGEVVKQSDESFVTERNTVKLFGDINGNEACLCVSEWDALLFSWDGKVLTYPPAGLTKRILYEQPFYLDTTYFESKVWVDLFSYANCFGANINILTEDSESYKYLGEVNLTQFDSCYTIETGIPFDEIYTEFMNNSELQFEWVDWGQEVGVSVAKGYDAVINDYQNIFTQIYYDKFESSDAYYDVLLKVLQCKPIDFGEENDLIANLEKMQENYDMQVNRSFFVADRFLKDDDPLVEKAKNHLEVSKVIYSAATDSAKVEQKYMTLIDTVSKMNGIELSILEKSLLDKGVKDEEAYNSKNPADYVSDYSQFMKKISPALSPALLGLYSNIESSTTKFQKIFESYSSLYDSANKLSDEIQDPSKLTQEKYNEMAENIFTFAGDTAIGEAVDKFAPQAKLVLDVYDIVLKEIKSDTMASVADTAQAHFIQETVLKNVRLDKSDASYYSMLMAMQSSYLANKSMLSIDANVSKEQAALAASDDMKMTSILFQLENLITQAYECNRNFYNSPETDWKKQVIEKVTNGKSSEMPDYSISTDLIKQELETPINWYLEPTIEAEDIIVSDDSVYTLFESIKASNTYSIIKRNGKYTMIDYNGQMVTEELYDRYYFADAGEVGLWRENISPYSLMAWGDEVNKDDYGVARGMTGGWAGFCYNSSDKTVYADRCFEYEIFDGNINDFSGYEEVKIPRAVLVQSANVKKNDSVDCNFYDVEVLGKYGIVYANQLVVDTIYEEGKMSLYNDMIALKKENKWGYFNGTTGEQVIDFIGNDISLNSETIHDNKTGEVIKEITYPYTFSDGYVALYTDSGCGYYDTQGNEVIPCGTFEEVRPVHNGLAWVKKDGKWGVIELDSVEEEKDTTVTEFNVNWQEIYAEELRGYLNSKEYMSDSMFDIFDIDGDDIPELVISDSAVHMGTCKIYTISNGNLVKPNDERYGSCGVVYCSEKLHMLYGDYLQQGRFTFSFYQLTKNGVERILSGYNDEYAVFDETPTYQIDGEDVTKEKYEEAYHKYNLEDFEEVGRKYELNESMIASVLLGEEVAELTEEAKTISDIEILWAVNKYLEENQGHLGYWLSNSEAYCPSTYMASNETNWSCPIDNYEYQYSPFKYIAGSYPYYAFVDKETLICSITADYETEVKFDLTEYIQ